MRAPRVLVVDDHLDTLQLLESYLSYAGFSVTLAGHAGQAIELAPSGFDAVITDLAMPGMDGRELIERLRVQQGRRPIPIVIVSGQIPPGRWPLDGVSYCALLRKPCDLAMLSDTLRELIVACPHDCEGCPNRRRAAPPQRLPRVLD